MEYQSIIALIPEDATRINNSVQISKDSEYFYYFVNGVVVDMHRKDDEISFKITISKFISLGYCRPIEILKNFPVSKSSLKKWVKRYKEEGPCGFFNRGKRKKGNVLTEEKIVEAERLLKMGYSMVDVSKEIGVKYDTLRKGVKSGRIKVSKSVEGVSNKATNLNEENCSINIMYKRSVEDSKAEYGVGCTRKVERMLASLGKLYEAKSRFEQVYDLDNGGVLCAIPGLTVNGLFKDIRNYFRLPKGYYGIIHIMCILAFIYLLRIKTIEQLRFKQSGELGKLLGLDRIPEVRTLRKKLNIICMDEKKILEWSEKLSEEWMKTHENELGVLLIDGHVSIYYGKKTKLPRRYVSRLKLCMRGISYYYVNDLRGQPFFRVSKVVDRGLLEALRNDIVPRLLKEVPSQPTEEELANDPDLHRFIIEFDREGYSPKFFRDMWEKYRIACITYDKYPGKKWDAKDFKEYEVVMQNGERTKMKLAEKLKVIGQKKDEQITVREIRKLSDSGHQTPVITTVRKLSIQILSYYMFKRWIQENFFKYMITHYALDKLVGYGIRPLSGTEKVINPVWREVNKQVNSINAKHRLAKFASLEIDLDNDNKNRERSIKIKSELFEEITQLEQELNELKQKRKTLPKYVLLKDLPVDFQFQKLESNRKFFTDTIKLIVYRTETAMAEMIKPYLGRKEDARPIIRELFTKQANLIPDYDNNILIVELHSFNTKRHNQAIDKLLQELNNTETLYPGTNMRLYYKLL